MRRRCKNLSLRKFLEKETMRKVHLWRSSMRRTSLKYCRGAEEGDEVQLEDEVVEEEPPSTPMTARVDALVSPLGRVTFYPLPLL